MNTILVNVNFQVMDMNKGRVVPGCRIKESYWRAIETDSLEDARAAIDDFIKEHSFVKALEDTNGN